MICADMLSKRIYCGLFLEQSRAAALLAKTMQKTRPPFTALYPQLVGNAWHYLDEKVRRNHLQDKVVFRAAGQFSIDCGNGCARLIGRLMGLPPPAVTVKTRLEIRSQEEVEEWRRTFGDKPLISMQYACSSGQLLERVGPFEIRFQVKAVNGELHYCQTGAAIWLGPWRLRIPLKLSPRVAAQEKASRAPNQVEVSVEVRLPLVGLLIRYEGTTRPEKAGQ
jgi:hypothetical protein